MSILLHADKFYRLFLAYMNTLDEEYLLKISELGEQMVLESVPPEEIAALFGESLQKLGKRMPGATLAQTAGSISVPLVELIIAYGLAFREQISRQQAYEESRLARTVIENTIEGIWVANEGDVLEFANPAFSSITGFETGSKGVHTGIYFQPGGEQLLVWADILEIVREKGRYRGEIKGLRDDGRTFPALVSISASRNDDGQMKYFVGVLEDITEQKEREANLALEISQTKEIYDMVIRCDPPVLPGLRFNVECLPAENVGGDTVEIYKIDQNRLLIFLADVVGHGLPAAMTANALKMLFSEIALNEHDPAVILTRLNKAMLPSILPDDIIACFCALIDTKAQTMTYALAGLPKPLIMRKNRIVELPPTNLPLGVFPSMKYHSRIMRLRKNDNIVAFTDGLIDVRDNEGRVLRSKSLLRGLPRSTSHPDEIIESLIRTARAHQGRSDFVDDVIVLVLRINADTAKEATWNKFSANNRSLFSFRAREVISVKIREEFIDDVLTAMMKEISKRAMLEEFHSLRMKTALFELVANAVEHGSLEITDYKNRQEFYDTKAYWTLFRKRMLSMKYGQRKITVDCVYMPGEIQVSVEDEGGGFIPEQIQNPMDTGNISKPSGRGLSLVRMCVDEIGFSNIGRRVTVKIKTAKSVV